MAVGVSTFTWVIHWIDVDITRHLRYGHRKRGRTDTAVLAERRSKANRRDGLGVSLAPAGVQKFSWKGVVYRQLAGLETTASVCWQNTGESWAIASFLKLARADLPRS